MDGLDIAFPITVGEEGGLSMDPSDRGNWTSGVVGKGLLRGTKYGISAMAFPSLDIASLTEDAAKALYRVNYWNKVSAGQMPIQVAVMAFDMAVNMGVQPAGEVIQQAVGADVDGWIGPQTLSAITAKGNDMPALLTEISVRRALRYAGMSTFSTYGLGWIRRVFSVFGQAQGAALPAT